MRYILFVGLFFFLSLSAAAQTIKVSNLLDPERPIGRGSLALIEPTGDLEFTDEEDANPTEAPTILGGVSVMIDGVPQRLRFVSGKRVEFLVGRAGRGQRSVELRTKLNLSHFASIKVVSAAPGIIVRSTGDDPEGFFPAGIYTLDPTGVITSPITSNGIPVGAISNPTRVSIQVVGLRPGGSTNGISVRLNGIQCVVVAVKPPTFIPGQEELTFFVPSFLANNGVMDLIVTVDGRASNPARLNLGGAVGLNLK